MIKLSAEIRKRVGEGDVFDAILNIEGEIFRAQKNRKTLFVQMGDRGYFLKIHRGVGWKEILKNLLTFRLPVLGAQNEARAIRRLEEIGVDTMKMVGFGTRGIPPAWIDSFVITEQLEHTVSLEDFCREWPKAPPAFPLKLGLIQKVADIARSLHQNGVNHRDFYLCHFLLDRKSLGEKPFRIFLIDLHRVQIRKNTPLRWIIKDLGGLFFSAMEIGLTHRDMFRFMKCYRQKPLAAILKDEKAFWARVRSRAERLYSKHKNRGL